MSDGRYQAINEPHIGFVYCEDCGAVVPEQLRPTHDRAHAIQNDTARAVAMLLVAHMREDLHDRYDVKERFDAKRNQNNWSAEAFSEVVGQAGVRVPAEPGVDTSDPNDHGIVRPFA